MSGRIDIHHHALPPEYLKECRSQIAGPAVDFDHVFGWTPEQSIAELEANGYEKAILSVSAPGVWFGDREQTVRLARVCNDYLASVRETRPERLGFFATVPLPDARASVTGVVRVLDELGADGVCVMSSYGQQWLGDPEFRPLFDELNERRAAVFVHPVIPPFCRGLMPVVPDALAEFAFDTTRTILSLLFGGVLSGCDQLRFAFSHGGGALPMILDRVVTFPQLRPSAAQAVPEGVMGALSRQFYDSGNMGNRAPLAALREAPGISQMVLASDFPYRPLRLAVPALAQAGVGEEEQLQIGRLNPLRFLAGDPAS